MVRVRGVILFSFLNKSLNMSCKCNVDLNTVYLHMNYITWGFIVLACSCLGNNVTTYTYM